METNEPVLLHLAGLVENLAALASEPTQNPEGRLRKIANAARIGLDQARLGDGVKTPQVSKRDPAVSGHPEDEPSERDVLLAILGEQRRLRLWLKERVAPILASCVTSPPSSPG